MTPPLVPLHCSVSFSLDGPKYQSQVSPLSRVRHSLSTLNPSVGGSLLARSGCGNLLARRGSGGVSWGAMEGGQGGVSWAADQVRQWRAAEGAKAWVERRAKHGSAVWLGGGQPRGWSPAHWLQLHTMVTVPPWRHWGAGGPSWEHRRQLLATAAQVQRDPPGGGQQLQGIVLGSLLQIQLDLLQIKEAEGIKVVDATLTLKPSSVASFGVINSSVQGWASVDSLLTTLEFHRVSEYSFANVYTGQKIFTLNPYFSNHVQNKDPK
jgi:hypothetical protein